MKRIDGHSKLGKRDQRNLVRLSIFKLKSMACQLVDESNISTDVLIYRRRRIQRNFTKTLLTKNIGERKSVMG